MSRWSLMVACLFLAGCGSAPSPPAAKMPPSVNVTGKWLGTYVTNVGTMPVELMLQQTDANVTGNAYVAGDSWTTSTYKGDINGTVNGNTFTYSYPGGGAELTVTASEMRGMTDNGKTVQLRRQ